MKPEYFQTTPEDTGDYSRKWPAMLAIGLGVFMATIDFSIVNVSLPTLVEQLNTDFPTIQWVVLSYALVIISTMLGVARLGDMYGKKKLYTLGLFLFLGGSLLCGLAPGVGWLIAFRALQGSGAVMTQALGTAIITEVFPSSERGRALGIVGGIVAIGLAMGPAVGGILIGLASWRWVFLVNVPIGVVAVYATIRFIPRSVRGPSGQRFDFLGAVTLMITLTAYALGMTWGQRYGFSSTAAISLLGVALAGLAFFIVTEIRTTDPMLDTTLFRDTLFSMNLIMAFLVFIVMSGMFVMPFFLELVKGYPTAYVGLFMMVVPISMGIISPAAGSLSDRFGPRGISLLGLMVTIGACLAIGTLHQNVTPLGYILRLAPLGIGMGLFQSPNNSAIMGAAPRNRLGVASGLMALSRVLGSASGIPLMGTLFVHQVLASAQNLKVENLTRAPREALVAGVTGTFRIAALVVTVSTLVAVAALWLDSRKKKKGT